MGGDNLSRMASGGLYFEMVVSSNRMNDLASRHAMEQIAANKNDILVGRNAWGIKRRQETRKRFAETTRHSLLTSLTLRANACPRYRRPAKPVTQSFAK